ncbi:MAG: site-specific DNA-methyltransferase, partial [Chloroflexi bacterium]|nr:site-specific DNA-methyltransferase [Chloroflexota bacterium]
MPTLEFKGKNHIYAHHLTVPYRPLQLDESRSILAPHPNPPQNEGGLQSDIPLTDQNLIIHGDNLEALKALLPHYAGRVKCIYIDPPYNTGNEGWVYNDNVNSPLMQDWFEKQSPVDGEDLERHDKWLCMMWPRLYLLRELLRDDGVIFVSIDENEVYHLQMLMNEIFGEENFVTQFVWQSRESVQNAEQSHQNLREGVEDLPSEL